MKRWAESMIMAIVLCAVALLVLALLQLIFKGEVKWS